MKVLLVVAIAGGVALAVAAPGRSCSRPGPAIPAEPRAQLADADAAFIGRLVAVRPKDESPVNSSGAPWVFTYAVEEAVKGELGDRVELTSALGGASCGLDGTIGDRVAFLLTRRTDAFAPWAVEEVDAATLHLGALPLPKPNGLGRPAFLVGGHFGLARDALLDVRGRTLGYGSGRGAVTALSICPGRTVAAELVQVGQSLRFALRRLPSLRLIKDEEIAANGYGNEVTCRSRFGSDALAGVKMLGAAQEAQLLQVSAVGTKVLERAAELTFAVRGSQAFVSFSDGRLVVRGLGSSARRQVARTGQLLTGTSVSPDRRFLAGFRAEQVVLVDLLRGVTKARPWSGYRTGASWVGPDTFVAWSAGAAGRLARFDRALRQLQPAVPWAAVSTAVGSDGGVFGVDWSGGLLTERSGSSLRVGQLFSPAIAVLIQLRRPAGSS